MDHSWLLEIMEVHRFPSWLCRVMRCLVASWNTRIVTTTKCGPETSRCSRFNRGLPQGDSLFTLCLNPIAWSLEDTEGYKLSKPVSAKVSYLMYIDDLKVFVSSEAKLNRVLESTSAAMEDIELTWSPKKCNLIHVRKGTQVHNAAGVRLGQEGVVESLDASSSYKFLGVRETVMQDEKLVCAAKAYLQRLSLIWSSSLSDSNRVTASNQFALPVLFYLMWTQHWPITELRLIDREARKIICENGGKHPLSSTATLSSTQGRGWAWPTLN